MYFLQRHYRGKAIIIDMRVLVLKDQKEGQGKWALTL